jgi:pyruvate-formate lyase-activating enzyme
MDHDNFCAIADTFRKIKHGIGVELLPYHPYGGTKNEQLGYGDNGRKDWVPSKEDLQLAKTILQSKNVTVVG